MNLDKTNARVQRMFGEIAPKYDRMNHLLSMHVDRYWRWRTVRMVQTQDSAPILDVCTGTGDLAFAFHRRTKGRLPVIGTDFCKEMLAVGEAKKQRRGIRDELTFVAADAQDLPFSDNHFQIVSVAFGLRNIADTDRGLREMTRVCQPRGQVAILEFSIPAWQPFKMLYGWYFRHVLPRLGQLLARNREQAYNYLPQSVSEFPSGAALAQRMRQAGLQEVRFHPLTLGIATLYMGTK
ncbi:MAG: bifunctional demethylmenaquinone methyltransferase/2-methoxy-6-polyprenyl-1,4-benzoquinol methylase UbiE [Planctomycetaceae bacterium]|nr:bifunctional demethylmenaquinone methyltransferase/2-methoxy-6-polyprenyl-1,4-benzoquinol methylase UbiE [Planctomycetaceae bacterium]